MITALNGSRLSKGAQAENKENRRRRDCASRTFSFNLGDVLVLMASQEECKHAVDWRKPL